MSIVKVEKENILDWATLCNNLWAEVTVEAMIDEFANGKYQNEYLFKLNNEYIGFISLSIRNEYVEGKINANPVGYLEGIYVKPKYRRKGIASKLVEFAKAWSLNNGCSMLASDCELDNEASRAFHKKLGFEEEGIIVHFSMKL